MSQTRARILFVDGHQDTRLMIMILLEQAGFGVVTAGTVTEALEISQEMPFDVCMTETKFPDGDGVEVCQRLHQISPDIVVIYYTGMARTEDEQRALQQCGQFYLREPACLADIQETIIKALVYKKNQQQSKM